MIFFFCGMLRASGLRLNGVFQEYRYNPVVWISIKIFPGLFIEMIS